jgi:hypothetical protein
MFHHCLCVYGSCRTETNETATAEIEHQVHHDEDQKTDCIEEADESEEAAAGTTKQQDAATSFKKPAADVRFLCFNLMSCLYYNLSTAAVVLCLYALQ